MELRLDQKCVNQATSLLDEADREAIRREKTHKWSQPKDLYMTVIICSLAAAVQGWDQTGSNGANLSFPTEFGIPTNDGAPNREHNEWIVGTINAGYVTPMLCRYGQAPS
ncbi:uncharacterized protein ARMOST_11876 [Armillaria ostoyae]|uniref:Uncharacterized protein n=1 Tax=Armillaria ostoyae TaxID=47428 RepID=A0A284RID8_ARMOS|nr:uncharacterized protein ARMOST_11876 [Armillaria ostoyae]